MEFAVLDGSGRCVNRVIWDGASDWQPPDGCSAVPDEVGAYQLGAPSLQRLTEPAAQTAGDPTTETATHEGSLDEDQAER